MAKKKQQQKQQSSVNPNKQHNDVDSYVTKTKEEQAALYPQFFSGIEFDSFRHIKNIKLNFIHPITVIAGSNKSGKTTILLSIACSHYNFMRRNVVSGNICRNTWGKVLRFVSGDKQEEDWTYYVDYREGSKITEHKMGQRKESSKKWSGVAKKEGQIGTPQGEKVKGGRHAYLIDMDRIIPARHLSDTEYKKVKGKTLEDTNELVDEYFSYIFETEYAVTKIGTSADKDIYAFATENNYSSYNSASGEDAITRIIRDIVSAPNNSLILIEEIEIGLHPKIQRRLMDVLFCESSKKSKQFVITTHSATILSSVKPESRIFIDSVNGGQRVIPQISINAALTKMDAESYPLVDIYVEDEVSQKMVQLAIKELNKIKSGFSKLVKVIIIGSAQQTFDFFTIRKRIYEEEKINRGYACILDGDMRDFGQDELLFYHYSEKDPETMLVTEYLKNTKCPKLSYHLKHSDNHCLFKKMVELGLATTEDEAFKLCWDDLLENPSGKEYFENLKNFILKICKHFSQDL